MLGVDDDSISFDATLRAPAAVIARIESALWAYGGDGIFRRKLYVNNDDEHDGDEYKSCAHKLSHYSGSERALVKVYGGRTFARKPDQAFAFTALAHNEAL